MTRCMVPIRFASPADADVKLADEKVIPVYTEEATTEVAGESPIESHPTQSTRNNRPYHQRLVSLRNGKPPYRSRSRSQGTSQPPHNQETSPVSPRNIISGVPSIKRKPAPRWSLFAFPDPFSHKPKQSSNVLSSGVSPEESNSSPSGYTEASVAPVSPRSESRTPSMSPGHLHTAQSRKTFEPPRKDHYSNSTPSPLVEPSHPSQSATAPAPVTLGRRPFNTSDSEVHLEDRGEADVKSPRNSQFAIHWILWHLDDDSYPLVVDLSKRKRDITNVLTHMSWWDIDVLSRPATRPPVPKLRLISPKTLTIDVVNDQGVTVSRYLAFFPRNA